MTDLTLHPMKEIRIIIQGEHLKFATDLLDQESHRLHHHPQHFGKRPPWISYGPSDVQ